MGVLFYELLTGRPPFDTKEGDLFNRIVTQPVRFPEAVAMPESAKALIRALLQKRFAGGMLCIFSSYAEVHHRVGPAAEALP